MTNNDTRGGIGELKPCPFCGGEAELSAPSGYVECVECGIQGPWGHNAEEAIAAWNTRTPDTGDGHE